jgi:hypothetical protein
VGKAVRWSLALLACISMLAFAGTVFWYQEWQYQLPTPRPEGLEQPPVGAFLNLPNELRANDGRPVMIHFFSDTCPCSRFNVDHIRYLKRSLGSKTRFFAVVEAKNADSALQNFAKLDLGIPAVADTTEGIAKRYGVYSTPQAVILTPEGQLVYRGNYNVSRYCTDVKTQFARIALEAYLHGENPPIFPQEAGIAYGCELPKRRRAPLASLMERL